MLRLMSFSSTEGYTPLYMAVVLRVLREMATAQGGGSFNYLEFKRRMAAATLKKDQDNLLQVRLHLLESYLDLPGEAIKAPKGVDIFVTEPGTLTVVGLTDPFIDVSTVCLLFHICMTLFKKHRLRSGLVVALDEAHKYMTTTGTAEHFTERLLTTIREQRHNATRVIIATQEPTISPRLMELSSITMVHRFTSPTWFTAIKGHLGGASALITTAEKQSDMFKDIMNLEAGQSFLFSSASYLCMKDGVVKKRARRS